MKISLNNLKVNIVLVLIILMPFHNLMIKLLNLQPLVLWRDVLIILLVMLGTIGGVRIDKLSMLSYIKIICCIVFAIFCHDSNMPIGIWTNALRVYLVPSFIILVLSNMHLDEQKLNRVLRTYVITSTIVAAFGLIQLFFIGRSYLSLIGVGQASVLLADGTQRNIGTFESANIMGMYLLFSITILLYKKDILKKKYQLPVIVLFLVSFVFTYSMSSFLALAIVLFIYIRNRDFAHIKIKHLLKGMLLSVVVILAILLLIINNPKILDVLQFQIGEKISEIFLTLLGNNTISNSSALEHYNDLFDGLSEVFKNPMGLGFAKESFMVLDKVTYRSLIGLRESSIITIFFDFGILIGIIFILPILYCLFRLKKSYCFCKDYCGLCIGIIVSMLVIYVFLPVVQSYELSFFLYMFMGLIYYYVGNCYENRFNSTNNLKLSSPYYKHKD